MRFVVDRVSAYGDEPGAQPCDGATLHTLRHKHRDEQVWVIELEDLTALLALAKLTKTDLIVGDVSDYYGGMGRVRIYDGYNE